MNSWIRMTIATAMATALIGTANPARASTEPTYYVSLGDSAAAGDQPLGTFSHGYADQLHQRIKATLPELQLLKLGCAGETAEGLISGTGSPCDHPSGSQLSDAIGFLQAHQGQIAFITINVGVNDVLERCFNGPTGVINLLCVHRTMPGLQADLTSIIEALRDAAPGVPIAGMSYWDPFLGLWTFDPLGKVLAVVDNRSMQELNAGLAATYQDEGALFADVAGPEYFNIGDFTHLVSTRWGRVPVNVANACRWTWFCSGTAFQGDPHPNTMGYGVIADAFQAVLRELTTHAHPSAAADCTGRCAEELAVARTATEKYQNVAVALADGYIPTSGCVTAEDEGADPSEGVMGIHFTDVQKDGNDLFDQILDVREPEQLLYVPDAMVPGGLRLVAIEYSAPALVSGQQWRGPNAPPEDVQPAPELFDHVFDGPMHGHDPLEIQPWHYDLHVWAWSDNPNGTFAHFNPREDCDPTTPPASESASTRRLP